MSRLIACLAMLASHRTSRCLSLSARIRGASAGATRARPSPFIGARKVRPLVGAAELAALQVEDEAEWGGRLRLKDWA